MKHHSKVLRENNMRVAKAWMDEWVYLYSGVMAGECLGHYVVIKELCYHRQVILLSAPVKCLTQITFCCTRLMCLQGVLIIIIIFIYVNLLYYHSNIYFWYWQTEAEGETGMCWLQMVPFEHLPPLTVPTQPPIPGSCEGCNFLAFFYRNLYEYQNFF